MGRNRVLGSPYESEVVSASFITEAHVDLYLIDAVLGSPVTATLDPNAFNGDQVVIQDVGDAAVQPITINASPGQTIVGFGSSIRIVTEGGGVQLTYDFGLNGWVPLMLSAGGQSAPVPWIQIAAGGTATVPSVPLAAYAFDTTGAQDRAVLPNTPIDGEVVILKAVGASNTNGINVVPGTGQSLEDPGNAGNILAANTPVTTFTQGGSLIYKYQAASTRWLIQSNA